MNGCARLNFEFIVHNHHHTPAFELGLGDSSGSSTLRFTPRWSIFELIQDFHSISTLPTSHYKYNKWLEKVEMGIWDLKWTSQRDFSVAGWVKVGFAMVHFPRQDCVSLDRFGQFTASQPLQRLIVGIMNGCARLRFESIVHNHHHVPAFESRVVTVPCLVW
eukprot:scaffold73069_cov41-Cyclotella_meneghiniana.AAC.1